MRTRGAVRRSWIVALVLAVVTRAASADDAWKERIGDELARVEAGVAALDGKTAGAGALGERVRALSDRLVLLEKSDGLPPGSVEAKEELTALTADVSRLATRWKAILRARNPEPEPAPAAPAQPPRPRTLPKVEWPKALPFNATAKLSYEVVGQHHPEYFAPNFLLLGYRGAISFSLRARGLVREVASARVEVLVRSQPPFGAETLRYEVSWVPEGGILGDGALRTWAEHDHREATSPVPQWVNRPPTRSARSSLDLRAEAHVLSVVTRTGETISFETPHTPLGLPVAEVVPAASPVPAAADAPFSTLAAQVEERVARARAEVTARGRKAIEVAATGDYGSWRPHHDVYVQALSAALRVTEEAIRDLSHRSADLADPKVAFLAVSAVQRHAALAGRLTASRLALEGGVAMLERVDASARAGVLRALAGPEHYVVSE